MTISDLFCFGGDKGNRTPDLVNANHALYHLSYTPTSRTIIQQKIAFVKSDFFKAQKFDPGSAAGYASASPSLIPRITMPTMTETTQAYWPARSFSLRNRCERMTDTIQ